MCVGWNLTCRFTQPNEQLLQFRVERDIKSRVCPRLRSLSSVGRAPRSHGRHVRWEVDRYRGDWRLRREVDRISADVNRVNWSYRYGYDTWRRRREIDGLRYELHQIEVRLHVRYGDYYRWAKSNN